MNLKLSDKGLILVLVPVAFMITFVSLLYYLFNEAEIAKERAEQSSLIVSTANSLITEFYNLGSTVVSYAATKNHLFKQRYEQVTARIPSELRQLLRLCHDNERQRKTVSRIYILAARIVSTLDLVEANIQEGSGRFLGKWAGLNDSLTPLQTILPDLMSELNEVVKIENPWVQHNSQTSEGLRAMVSYCVIAGIIGSIAIALCLNYYFNREASQRLAVVVENTVHLARREPLNQPLAGRDEIAHLDRTFHDMVTQLAAVERLKQEFVAMVSHDLRTPLTSVQLTMEMLTEGICGKLPDAADSKLEASRRQISRCIILINNLLDLEKLQAGQMQLVVTRLDLGDLLQHAVEAVSAIADSRNVSIDCQQSKCRVFADKERLAQVLVNLLGNAVKFSPDGGVVAITVVAGSELTKINITDQGRGVPAEQRTAIFERFHQVSISDQKEKGGTGLGLPICKAIVEAQGGTIGVESQPGQGSTFWFTVPAAN